MTDKLKLKPALYMFVGKLMVRRMVQKNTSFTLQERLEHFMRHKGINLHVKTRSSFKSESPNDAEPVSLI